MTFDRVARAYSTMEYLVFGSTLRRARTALIGELGTPRTALLIGDGDGRFSSELLRRFPALILDIIEPSAAMAQIARRRAGPDALRRATWHALPAQQFDPGNRVWDLVVTQFSLDVLEQSEAEALIEKLAPRTDLWLVAEFHPGVFDPLLSTMYLFFRLTAGLRVSSIPDYQPALRRAGFTLLASRAFWRGFVTAELYGASSPGRRISLVT